MAKGLKKVFVVHGEPAQSAALAVVIKQQFGLECMIPARGDTVELS
jgi:metallo-beta-lactamase family protein